jgi:uncharacterized SAM-binding protein YcdF (DUF218 family)
MFFTLSKVLWFVADPGNLFFIALLIGVALLATRWRRAGQRLLAAVAAVALFVAVVPVGAWLIGFLEDRFPAVDQPPARVDGVVVLGGVVHPALSAARGRPAIGGAVERLFTMAALAKRYPQAKLVFSGGSGSLVHQDKKEARLIAPLLAELGIDPARVVFEDQSRNTVENAEFSRRVAQPKSGETWLLVTSAFHMPRAVGSFRRAGWNVVAYPVDHLTAGESEPPIQFDFAGGLRGLSVSVHEYLGLLFYWLGGKTDALLPAPS